MLWYYFCRMLIRSVKDLPSKHYSNDTRPQEHIVGWGIGTHLALLFTALIVGATLASNKQSNSDITATIVFTFILLVSSIDYVISGYRALSHKDIEVTQKAKLLCRDRSLEPEWRRRAKIIRDIAKKMDQKEARYGSYPEITTARKQLDAALVCIVRHSMIMQREHADIVQNEVDAILSAYAELN